MERAWNWAIVRAWRILARSELRQMTQGPEILRQAQQVHPVRLGTKSRPSDCGAGFKGRR